METKFCRKCQTEKPTTEFHRRSEVNGYVAHCKSCKSATHQARTAKRVAEQNYLLVSAKFCSGCKNSKPIEEFAKQVVSPDGHASLCKVCNKAYLLRHKYRLSLQEHQGLYVGQEQRCAICRMEYPLEELAVDHCHSTNVVRGLLCRGCNTGLGCFKEDLERLERAINYLRSFARRC